LTLLDDFCSESVFIGLILCEIIYLSLIFITYAIYIISYAAFFVFDPLVFLELMTFIFCVRLFFCFFFCARHVQLGASDEKSKVVNDASVGDPSRFPIEPSWPCKHRINLVNFHEQFRTTGFQELPCPSCDSFIGYMRIFPHFIFNHFPDVVCVPELVDVELAELMLDHIIRSNSLYLMRNAATFRILHLGFFGFALQLALSVGTDEMFQFIVNLDGITAEQSDLDYAVLLCLSHGKFGSLSYLLDAGANVNALHTHGLTALQMAILDNDLPSIRCLVEMTGRDSVNFSVLPSNYPLNLAVLKDQEEAVRILLQAGADPKFPASPKSPIIYGARNEVIFELLLGATDHRKYFWPSGYNLLHRFVIEAKISLAKILLHRGGFDFRLQNGKICFLLHTIVIFGDTEVLRFLLEKGADIYEAPDEFTQKMISNRITGCRFKTCPAAVFAVLLGHTQILELFLEFGFDPNYRFSMFDGTTWSLLHAACGLNLVDVARILISFGADTNCIDSRGRNVFFGDYLKFESTVMSGCASSLKNHS
jgi:ankyrin repeat protein